MTETDEAVFATVDLKYCYDWMWPKPITTKTDDNRFELERFSQFRAQAVKFAKDYDGVFMEADPTKEVVEYYDG